MAPLCLSLWVAFALAQAAVEDSVFVPPKPEKPLRYCKAARQWVEYALADTNLVEITKMKGVVMNLRYATFDNVSGHDIYCGLHRAFLHRDAYGKLKRAVTLLEKEMPGYHIVVFDASRPLYAQEILRRTVRGTAYSSFVASPSTGGMHNYGLAIDMTVADSSGALLDMGTDFDSFERVAGSVGEEDGLKSGRLSQTQVDNRNKLRSIMKKAGWSLLPSEWWHFNAFPSKFVRENYPKFEF
ncbi:MAG: M15 family metallopeptidase [Fibrobacteraceae bacterium]|nr:M15 family metallopeptidase [Fibrobacteraceae bacterium]